MKLYRERDLAFQLISAYAVLKDGNHVANINIRYPTGRSLRLRAFLHVLGTPIAKGFAGGGGYDKKSAALESAAESLSLDNAPYEPDESTLECWHEIRSALTNIGGSQWDHRLRDAGFDVLCVV
jgi:hypothetical protein